MLLLDVFDLKTFNNFWWATYIQAAEIFFIYFNLPLLCSERMEKRFWWGE